MAGGLSRLSALGALDMWAGRPLGTATGTVVAMVFGALTQAPFEAPFGAPVRASVGALVSAPVDRVEVRAGAVSPGPCARTAGRIGFDRSGRLRNSHGSRLFKGEGPTGEDNAARVAGPPTG
ncbi:hypothetical protein ACGF12_30140 [Kitasatospora sp. NPDC048296]|uniref:hypothetical protein n=1 Tax=Kitasatospora sp. NPDC048296 TaxID=3364048 RepID=UPI0037243FB4